MGNCQLENISKSKENHCHLQYGEFIHYSYKNVVLLNSIILTYQSSTRCVTINTTCFNNVNDLRFIAFVIDSLKNLLVDNTLVKLR